MRGTSRSETTAPRTLPGPLARANPPGVLRLLGQQPGDGDLQLRVRHLAPPARGEHLGQRPPPQPRPPPAASRRPRGVSACLPVTSTAVGKIFSDRMPGATKNGAAQQPDLLGRDLDSPASSRTSSAARRRTPSSPWSSGSSSPATISSPAGRLAGSGTVCALSLPEVGRGPQVHARRAPRAPDAPLR